MRVMLIRSIVRPALLCAAVIVFAAVSSSAQRPRRGSAESEAILPQIDVIQVKESSDEALRATRDAQREIETLSARITQLDNRMILMSEEVANVSSAKIEELESRLALLTEAYKELFVRAQTLALQMERIQRPASPAAPAVAPTFKPSEAGGLLLASPEYDLYQSGLRLFNSRSYNQAARVFAECIAKFPDGVYRDRAQYWIGECHYQMAQMERAIEAYRKVLAVPNSAMAPNAQFKIALAYQKLGQIERARAEFRRLIDRYPASEFVERAKKYLADLR